MLSFTINDQDFECPGGYGEISIERYAAFVATVVPLAPKLPMVASNPIAKGFTKRLTQRLNEARIAISFDPLAHYEQTMVYNRAFISHWLKAPESLVETILDEQVIHLVTFFSREWSAWQPKRITVFAYAGKVWDVDYSLDTLGSVTDPSDMQQVMAHICKSHGHRMGPRDWGGVSLDIAASILHEIKRRHSIIAPIMGASILNTFKIDYNGK